MSRRGEWQPLCAQDNTEKDKHQHAKKTVICNRSLKVNLYKLFFYYLIFLINQKKKKKISYSTFSQPNQALKKN